MEENIYSELMEVVKESTKIITEVQKDMHDQQFQHYKTVQESYSVFKKFTTAIVIISVSVVMIFGICSTLISIMTYYKLIDEVYGYDKFSQSQTQTDDIQTQNQIFN